MSRRAAVPQEDALVYFLRLPTHERSLRRVADDLGVAYNTAKKWSRNHDWQRLAANYDEDMRADSEQVARLLAHGEEACMHDRHIALGRELQRMALEWAQRLAEEEEPRSPGEVVKWAEAGVRIERLAAGASTSRVENVSVWNDAAMAFLGLVEQVVVPRLPASDRELVLQDLAEGVNAIGERTLPVVEGKVTMTS